MPYTGDQALTTIEQIRKDITRGEVSPAEVTQLYLDRAKQSKTNSYITICEDIALEAAKSLAGLQPGGGGPGENARGMLHGVPIGVKDLFCTNGVRTTSASRMLENYIPIYESTVTKRLWEQGGIMLGKLNMDEFAMGSENKNSFFGPVLSPWKTKEGEPLVPGGSSGGSAAAVAAGLCVAATGSDTGGSVRQPAAFCGLVGFKPSYGRCSRYGMIAYSSSLDQAGFLTRTAEDALIMLESTMGPDGMDSTMQENACAVRPQEGGKLAGRALKVGLVRELSDIKIDPDIEASFQESASRLEKDGCEVREVSVPLLGSAIQAYYFTSLAEASSNLARYDGLKYGFCMPNISELKLSDLVTANRSKGFGTEVKRRILLGTSIIKRESYLQDYQHIVALRENLKQQFCEVFQQVDVLLLPTTPNLPYAISANVATVDSCKNDILTVPANMAGLPAISVPSCLSKDGRPIGMQLIANRFDEASLFAAAFKLENAWEFNSKYSNELLSCIGA